MPHLEVFEIQGFTSNFFISIAKNKVVDLLQTVGLATQDPQITFRNTPINDAGSIVLSISKDILDLNTPQKMFIQVCTLKGGIESFEGKERPITALQNGKPICDVADAFGEQNTEKRILTEFQPGKPSIIQGYAVGIE